VFSLNFFLVPEAHQVHKTLLVAESTRSIILGKLLV